MKKRYVGLLIAAALMAQPLTAYAAGSVSSRPSHDNSSSRSESLKTGKLEQSAAPVVNNGGAAASGSVTFATDNNALREAGLSWDLIDKINTINAGTEALYRTIGTNNMVGYVSTGSDSTGRRRRQPEPLRAEPGRRTERCSDSVLQPDNKGMGADGA